MLLSRRYYQSYFPNQTKLSCFWMEEEHIFAFFLNTGQHKKLV